MSETVQPAEEFGDVTEQWADLWAMFDAPEPRYPIGTPEYAAYAAELRDELRKWANGEPPYPYVTSIMAPDLDDPAPTNEPACCGGAGVVDLGSITVPCPEPECGWCACGERVTAGFPHACAWSAVSAR